MIYLFVKNEKNIFINLRDQIQKDKPLVTYICLITIISLLLGD